MVKCPYWGVLNYADNLWIKISPIFYIANANPNPAGPCTPQHGNYPKISMERKLVNPKITAQILGNKINMG